MNNSMLNPDEPYINATRIWLKTLIIEYSICPFAKRELERGSIRFSVNQDPETATCLVDLMIECDRLDNDPTIETTLLIYGRAFAQFDDYLDFLELAEALLIDQGYEGIYQLASFHPHYCFEGAGQDDAANYTNRSPYPMLHVLRESSIEQALTAYPHPEAIPERNIALMRKLGITSVKTLLAACYPVRV
jgi:hypothetical protein